MAADEDSAFALQPDGLLLWRGEAAGQLTGGTPLAARVRLFGELGPERARERAARRLEAFISAEAGRRLGPLRRLDAAVADGRLRGLARGLAYRLIESGGVHDRRAVDSDVRALSQAERRALKGLGVRIGAFSIYLPGLLSERARSFAAAFAWPGAEGWRPPHDRISALPSPSAPGPALAATGLRAVGELAVPVEALERLDTLLRVAPRQSGAALLSQQAVEELGWTMAQAEQVMLGLGFASTGRRPAGQAGAWRPKRTQPSVTPSKPSAHSPFAALAALKPAPAPVRRRRPRKRART